MKIAIVDDNARDAAALGGCMERFRDTEAEPLEIFVFSDSLDFAEFPPDGFDAVFLDIEMPHLSGMELAKRLRKEGSDCCIAFVTNQPQYALQGYEVEAVSYLIKPVKYAGVATALKRVKQRLAARRREVNVVINTRQELKVLPSSEILYVEAEKHNLLWHTAGGEIFRTRDSMKAAEEKLAEADFCRCNSGYLVNLRRVDCIRGNTVFVGGEELLISRHKKKEFTERYTRNAR